MSLALAISKMKLDYDTLQFERQLKQAKRLSLLEYTANERRRQQQNGVLTVAKKRSRVDIIEPKRKKIKQVKSDVMKKVSQSVACKIIRRRRVCQKPKLKHQRAVLKHSAAPSHVPCAESQQLLDNNACGQIANVDINSKLEIVPISRSTGHSMPIESSTSISNSGSARTLLQPSFRVIEDYVAPPAFGHQSDSFYRYIEKGPEDLDEEVEYDMDEQDVAWLKLFNEERRRLNKTQKVPPLTFDTFEWLIDRFEKEAHQLSCDTIMCSSQACTVDSAGLQNDDDAFCNICGDDECTNVNVILFCDSCNLAVHQECYGVPFVPEGQWLCRLCQAGIGPDVECCLCPVRGGAVKRTDDGRWAHVVCALWVPEVGFGSIEFLEPITKLDRIPPARRRLTCAVCSRSGIGACVQCMRKHCYKAFHITCAQQVGLFMKIEPVFNSEGMMINVSKTLLCDNHKPPGARPFQPMIDNSVDGGDDEKSPTPEKIRKMPPPIQGRRRSQQKRKGARASDERNITSCCEVPVIPLDRLASIAESMSMRDKNQIINKLQAYWTLKRRSRNGLPLLRRLQFETTSSVAPSKSGEGKESSGVVTDFMCVRKLRQQMEKVRLLLELVRKREKTKRELLKAHESMLMLKLEPFAVQLRKVLDMLQAFDAANIFSVPVSAKDAPFYYSVIKHPMDFSTMRDKIDRHAYPTFEKFEADFWLIVNNCKAYNEDGSLYHNQAVTLGEQGSEVLEAVRHSIVRDQYCPFTGMLPPADALDPASQLTAPGKVHGRRLSEYIGCSDSGNEAARLVNRRRHSMNDMSPNMIRNHILANQHLSRIDMIKQEPKEKTKRPCELIVDTELPCSNTQRRHSNAKEIVSPSVKQSVVQNLTLWDELSDKVIDWMFEPMDMRPAGKIGSAGKVHWKHRTDVKKKRTGRRRRPPSGFPDKPKPKSKLMKMQMLAKRKKNEAVNAELSEKEKKPSHDTNSDDVASSEEISTKQLLPGNEEALDDATTVDDHENPVRRFTRALRRTSCEENLSEGLARPRRKRRKHLQEHAADTSHKDDELPVLSRCPSPVEIERTRGNVPSMTELPAVESVSTSKPPSLVSSQTCFVSLKSIDESDCVRRLIAVASKDLNVASLTESTKGINSKTSAAAELPVARPPSGDTDSSLPTTTTNRDGPVSPEDTLDSVVSADYQSHTAVNGPEREGLFDRFVAIATVQADCDSSYGSACGRGGAGGAVTSDSDGTSYSPVHAHSAGGSTLDSDGTSGSPTDRLVIDLDSALCNDHYVESGSSCDVTKCVGGSTSKDLLPNAADGKATVVEDVKGPRSDKAAPSAAAAVVTPVELNESVLHQDVESKSQNCVCL